MIKKPAAALALLFLAPSLGLISVGALVTPALSATGGCVAPGAGLTVSEIPDSLTVTTTQGETFTLHRAQLTHAATIIEAGSQIDGVTRDGMQIALMAALTESKLRMLANTSTYPASGNYPHDGSDHDSLGLFQMRPRSGWGTVAELMDPGYQVRAFFGGPSGPNHGSPRGLLDIPGWEQMDKGEAAQAVEVSAFPDRYRNYEPVAAQLLDALTRGTPDGTDDTGDDDGAAAGEIAETSRIVFPLPDGTWVMTSPFGQRVHPITGETKLHGGTDFSAPDGTAIFAAADGVVTVAEYTDSGGGKIAIEHTIDGRRVATVYIHMWQDGIHVQPGELVTAGQHIGDVGSSGPSTGPHLHFEVRSGGTNADPVDSAVWLNDHHAADLPETGGTDPGGPDSSGCAPRTAAGDEPEPFTGDPDRMVDDPTSDGQITARTLHLYQQATAAFPDTSWACYSPRPGTRSEHPLGRACDITFGNPIGTRPTPAQLEAGWAVTNWMKTHAQTLGVEYLIWQGQIWSHARDDEGWRPYNGGGMHDPGDVTGGHYDHLHVTVEGNDAGGDAR